MKELPFKFPPMETYQGMAFVMGILLADPTKDKVRWNHYVNLQCVKTERLTNAKLTFTDALWEEYRLEGLAEMSLYDVANFSAETLERFLCERIDQGNYLLLYDIDEYYLSYTEAFEKEHYNHDTYVYGYSEKDFLVFAYRKEHLASFPVPKQEIINSLLSNQAYKNLNFRRDFCTFRPSVNRSVRLDRKKIRREIQNYLERRTLGKAEENRAYGLAVYDVLLEGLDRLSASGSLNHLDLRPFRCLMEHKRIARDRAAVLIKAQDPLILRAGSMVEQAEIIFRLMMKYNLTFDKNALRKARARIEQLRKEDEAWCKEYLEQM